MGRNVTNNNSLACPRIPCTITSGAPPLTRQRVYKGFVFSTPRKPGPGQDVVWTLAGFVQFTDLGNAEFMCGNARRAVFGWFAQRTEVA